MDNTFHNKHLEPNPLGSGQSLTDDQSSLVDEGYWHDNDLLLAAELGKALLDRNRVLEQALEKARLAEEEKTAEVEFLLKQLTELRELSQRKSAFVDEADSYNMELDRNNRRLMKQMIADKQKISRLSSNVVHLEQQVNDLLDQLAECGQHSVDLRTLPTRLSTRPLTHSPSPTRFISPPSSPRPRDTASQGFHRPRSGTGRGQFIDDELMDQPQLSLLSPPAFPLPWTSSPNSFLTGAVNRVTSWPLLDSPMGLSCALDLELSYANRYRSKWNTSVLSEGQNGTGLFARAKPKTDDDANVESLAQFANPSTNFINHCPRCGFIMHSSTKPNKNSEDNANKHSLSATESTQTIPMSETRSDSGAHLREIQDLLDDAAFIRRLENIYSLKLQCGVPALTSGDYQPQYKQLFRDAFRMLRKLKRGHAGNRMGPLVEEEA